MSRFLRTEQTVAVKVPTGDHPETSNKFSSKADLAQIAILSDFQR
jgi:hypothetical protein